MINVAIGFILRAIALNVGRLCLPASLLHEKTPWQYLCCKQRKMVAPQYRKRFTIAIY
ncbi:MAG: hypothetical protein LBK18_10130 [Prevotellaceae bacterium]|nr:hypothetical protein [Prevotellaceae bacterium]